MALLGILSGGCRTRRNKRAIFQRYRTRKGESRWEPTESISSSGSSRINMIKKCSEVRSQIEGRGGSYCGARNLDSLRACPIQFFASSVFWGALGLFVGVCSLYAGQSGGPPHGAITFAAGEDASQAIGAVIRRIVDERKAAVVRVAATDKRGKLYGSGFFADPSGTVYTLSTIVEGATSITVIQGDKKLPARLLASDPRSGVALIKVNERTAFLPLGDSSKVQIADPILAIGYPMNSQESPSFGLVAGFERKYMGSYFATTHIRANVPVQRGLGGAPALNMDGEVIGMVISGLDGGVGCYILPIAAMEKVWRDFERFGEIRHGWIGVMIDESEQAVEGSTAAISGLQPGTPAASCGLKLGDIIIRLGQTRIHTVEDVLDASFFLTAGEPTQIVVVREGKQLTLQVKSVARSLSEAPEIQVEQLNLRIVVPATNGEIFPGFLR